MSRIVRLGMTLGLGAALFFQASVSSAKITWNLKPTGMGDYDWTLRQHWNFNRTGASGTYGPCTGNCNFHSLGDFDDPDVSWGGPGMAAPECLEITTYPGAFTSNPDTVIEVTDANYDWQRVSDDFGGTLQSHARIWIEPVNTTMTFHLRVRAYSSTHNTDDFDVTITRRDITKSACTSGQTTIPWVQITDSPQFTVNMSTFH